MSPCNPLYPQKGQSHLSSTSLFPVLQKSPFSSFSSSIFHIGHEGGGWPNRPLLSISVPLLSPHFSSLLPSFRTSFPFPSFPFPISFPVSCLPPSPPRTRGGERAGWQSSSCIHSLFRPSYPPFSSPTYPCFPAFPVLPCLYLLSSQKLSQKLVRFPKNLSVIPEKWLIYWLPKNLPFSQKLDDFPKNFPRFYFLGSFQGETRGIGGVVAAVPSVLSKQCLSSLLVSF